MPTGLRPFPNAPSSRKAKAQSTPGLRRHRSSRRGGRDEAPGECGLPSSLSKRGRPASPRGLKGRRPRGDSRLPPSWPPASQGTRPAAPHSDGPQSPRSILSTCALRRRSSRGPWARSRTRTQHAHCACTNAQAWPAAQARPGHLTAQARLVTRQPRPGWSPDSPGPGWSPDSWRHLPQKPPPSVR